MHVVLLALIVVTAGLMAVTGAIGVALDGDERMMQHWVLGLFTTIVTCFVHCFVMFYLIGSGKDIREAVEDHPTLEKKFVPLTREFKRRAFPPACLGVFTIVVAALMGGEVHSRLIRPSGELPLRDVPGWWIHLLCVAGALAANAWAFRAELTVARANRAAIEEINATLED